MTTGPERKTPGRKSWITAATLGSFFTALAGMLMLIGVLPLGPLERTVIGSLAFAPLWTGLIVLACLAPNASQAWRRQLGLLVLFAAVAAVGLGLRG